MQPVAVDGPFSLLWGRLELRGSCPQSRKHLHHNAGHTFASITTIVLRAALSRTGATSGYWHQQYSGSGLRDAVAGSASQILQTWYDKKNVRDLTNNFLYGLCVKMIVFWNILS